MAPWGTVETVPKGWQGRPRRRCVRAGPTPPVAWMERPRPGCRAGSCSPARGGGTPRGYVRERRCSLFASLGDRGLRPPLCNGDRDPKLHRALQLSADRLRPRVRVHGRHSRAPPRDAGRRRTRVPSARSAPAGRRSRPEGPWRTGAAAPSGRSPAGARSASPPGRTPTALGPPSSRPRPATRRVEPPGVRGGSAPVPVPPAAPPRAPRPPPPNPRDACLPMVVGGSYGGSGTAGTPARRSGRPLPPATRR